MAVVPPHFHYRNRSESGAELLGVLGTQNKAYAVVGNEGSLFAIEKINGQPNIRWRVDNITATEIFLTPGIVIVKLYIPIKKTPTQHLTHIIRAYSLVDGKLLWQRSRPIKGFYSRLPGLGPMACDVACGLPCSLVATANESFGAIDPNTGKTMARD